MLDAIRTLDYVVLLCHDLDRMRQFYHETLGLPIELDTGSWIEMRLGAVRLTLSTIDRPFVGSPTPDDSASVQLAFRVALDEVQSCFEALVEKGVDIVQPPRDIDERLWRYWKHRTLFFRDPEGNLLEIYAELDGDG